MPDPDRRHVTDAELNHLRPLVDKLIGGLKARDQLQPHLEREDLQSVGMTAAWCALLRYNPVHGASEATYVAHRVVGALLDHQRTQSRANGYTRHHGRVAQIVSLHQHVPSGYDNRPIELGDTIPDQADIADRCETRAEAALILSVARRMTVRQRTIIAGIAGDYTNRAIAEHLGVSESRISQLRSRLPGEFARAAA